MKKQEAIKKIWLLRNKYECLTYQEAEKISITNAEFVDAIQIAIEALEKQIPKKPYKHEENYYVCPKCDCSVYRLDVAKLCNITYCWHCGQAIDWSDTNE